VKADLHIHTHFSDGVDSPSTMIERAAGLHFDIIGVADHDTVDGVEKTLEAGRQFGVRIVPGVEVTSQWEGRELHMLGYFSSELPAGAGWRSPELLNYLGTFAQYRRNRAGQIVERLKTLGVSLDMEDLQKQVGKGTVGRPHIAAALLAKKYVSSIGDAFDKYLKRGCPAFVDKPRPMASEVIQQIHRARGLAVMGHPGLFRDGFFPADLVREGLDGLEVYHSRHNHLQSAQYLQFARQQNLLVTGGSDCHGNLKGEPLLGQVEFDGEELDRFLKRLTQVAAA
jgi:predicted metal-dependent phosphoesterase TrpH